MKKLLQIFILLNFATGIFAVEEPAVAQAALPSQFETYLLKEVFTENGIQYGLFVNPEDENDKIIEPMSSFKVQRT